MLPPKPAPAIAWVDVDDDDDVKTTNYDRAATSAALAALVAGAPPSEIIGALVGLPGDHAAARPPSDATSDADTTNELLVFRVPVPPAPLPAPRTITVRPRLSPPLVAPLPRLTPPPREASLASRRAITEPPAPDAVAAEIAFPAPALLPSDISDIVPTEMLAASTSARGRPLAAVAVVVLALAASVALLLRPHQGTVVIAARSAGRGLTAAQVLVDGRTACATLPCRVPALEHGTHTVRVDAPGFAPAVDLVSVRSGEDAPITLELVRERVSPPVPVAPKAVAVAMPAPIEPIEPPRAPVVPDAPAAAATRVAPRTTSAPTAAKSEVKAMTVAKGTLSLDSSPPSKVVLDGRPLGSTPKAGIPVAGGSHTVLFVNPGGGRRSLSVNVKPGESRSVSVKLR